MRAWVAELAAGHGRAVLVEGEPGIGKSSLMREAAAQAEAAGCQVFWGTCDELSQAFPLLPLLDALEPAAGDARGRITELLHAEPVPGVPVDLVTAATERLLVMVDELCAKAPVLLIIDDLQWADPTTVLAWSRLARSVRQLPLLLVALTRPVPRRDDLSALRRAVEPPGLLRMHSLTDPEAAQLVEQVLGRPPGPRLLRFAAGAAGNPLFLTELIDALVRGNALTVEHDVVELTGGRAPASLAAAIADRLEFLSAPVREVLQAAALLGKDFSVSELAVVCGRRVGDLLPALDEAIVTGVLREKGSDLSFRHPLIRAALYEAMPAAVRAAWHRDAGRALAQDGAPADRVARQLLPALDVNDTGAPVPEWVARWLVQSAQQLIGHAPHVAVPLLRWAVAGIPTGAAPHDVLTCRLADALFRVGEADAAAQVATGALGYVTRPDLLVELHWTLAQCRRMVGRSEESLVVLDRALENPGIGPGHRARLLVLGARTYCGLGRVDQAGEVAAAALAEATSAGDRFATGWALLVLTMVNGMRGDVAEALPLVDRGLAVAEGDPALADLRLVLQINQAVALGDLDRHDEAIATAQQVRQLADDAGNVVRLAQAQSVLGELLFDVGRWDDALAEVDLEVQPGLSKDPVVECCDHGVSATIRLHRADGSACQHLTDVEPYAARLGSRVIGSLTLARSLDREQSGAPEEALAVLMNGLADTAEEVEQTGELLADAVRLALEIDDRTAASDVIQRADEVARESDVPHLQAVALHCHGLVEHDPRQLIRAADRYEIAGRTLPRAQALEAAAVALADSGDATAARARFTDAFSLYSRLGADWDLARLQARLRAYGIRRGPHVRHRRSQQGWDSLTATELKVAGLVADGMSNPQIAAHLFLSRRTVQTHVSHILAKLDLHSRTDIAREASRREIVGQS
jgi:DNA-binding CsgD family transcriptional regulator/tetratricopeptide (TPR) repeat protein